MIKDAKAGAQTSIYCAVAEELDSVTGKYFRSAFIYYNIEEIYLVSFNIKYKRTHVHVLQSVFCNNRGYVDKGGHSLTSGNKM